MKYPESWLPLRAEHGSRCDLATCLGYHASKIGGPGRDTRKGVADHAPMAAFRETNAEPGLCHAGSD